MRCEGCSSSLENLSRFCPNCGSPLENVRGLDQPVDAVNEALESRAEIAASPGRVKIGGWMIVFCVITTIVLPISSCSSFAEYANAPARYGIDAESEVYRALGINSIGSLLIGIYSFISGLLIWKGSPSGRRIAYSFLLAYPASAIICNLIAIEMLKGTGSGQISVELLKGIIGSIMFSAIWLAYFKLSKRVRETYVGKSQ